MKYCLKISALLLALLLLLPATPAMAANDTRMIKVGLYYGTAAMSSANLENSVGSGYRFGYHDGSGNFVQLGSTDTTQISMLKTQNIYLLGDLYYDTNPGSGSVIGCYHLQLPGSYDSFAAAQSAASQYQGGFPAWISGTYYARVGAYASNEAAESAKGSLGLAAATVVGTGSGGISVTKTKTTNILFQFDSGGEKPLAVRPGTTDSAQTLTWFKGYKYYGDFCYERIGGGNLTISNYVNMDDYAKGVVPYEMSASWPLEALKAQAVAAKSYALSTSGKHKSHNFDLCNTTCCQVYRGANNASDNSDAAVDAVSGIYAWYDGKFAQTFYYSSNGGASEDVQNIWTATLPYLTGVVDPYEESAAGNTSNYRWTITYTGAQLASRLQQRGYSCGSSITELKITEFTRMGNVYSISMTDNNGKVISLSKEKVRSALGTNSFRFQLEGAGGSANTYYVDGGNATISQLDGIWAIGDNGTKTQLSAAPYAITSNGTEQLSTGGGTGSVSGTFVLTGAGNGHNVGMSQYGANAMAKQGFTYDQILKFYYTGIDLH